LRANRENSAYKDWFKNVHFGGNTDYNDGFYYESWDKHGTLANVNHQNAAVREYMLDAVRYWINEFDIDGIRLDAADVLDFTFMSELRGLTDTLKPDFWLMGEVIHGDYTRWMGDNMLHSVTNYWLHKALYSGHNDHNYFEITHTVKRCVDMGQNISNAFYNFVDNHDVARIYNKLNNKAHFAPVHVLLYTLPGKPSIYYGSEFAIEGEKMSYSDDNLRPELKFEDYKDADKENDYTKIIKALGNMRLSNPWLGEATYRELLLTNRQYAFLREYGDRRLIAIVNNDDNNADIHLNISGEFLKYKRRI
jgi:glycosidase family protein